MRDTRVRGWDGRGESGAEHLPKPAVVEKETNIDHKENDKTTLRPRLSQPIKIWPLAKTAVVAKTEGKFFFGHETYFQKEMPLLTIKIKVSRIVL